MKWRILLNLPSYPVNKQSKIIVACMALHNFIRECDLEDPHFQDVEDDSPHPIYDNTDDGGTGDDVMNAFRDAVATAMVSWFSCIPYLCTRSLENSAGTCIGIL